MFRKRSRWTGRGASLILEIHALDAVIFDGEDVPDLTIGENMALEILNKLVNSNLCLASSEINDFTWLYVGVERRPLASPVGPYFILANDLAAL
jgi:hypothetical protein